LVAAIGIETTTQTFHIALLDIEMKCSGESVPFADMVERGKVPQSNWPLISQQAVIFLALFVLRQKRTLSQ